MILRTFFVDTENKTFIRRLVFQWTETVGYGFIIGDGHLNYAPEEILETYYLWKPVHYLGFSPDFQFVNHPAYNTDRGPVLIMAIRVHVEY